MLTQKKELIEKVYKILGEVLMCTFPEDSRDLSTELTELGFNSMNFVKLGVIIEEEFGLMLSVAELDFNNNVFSTVKSLVDFLDEKLGSK